MSHMSYKGYSAVVEFDMQDRILVGHLAGVKQAGGFHADNAVDLEHGFHEAVDHYLEICKRRGVDPVKPYSGKITLRVPPELHAAVAQAAELNHTSINQFVSGCLKNAVHLTPAR